VNSPLKSATGPCRQASKREAGVTTIEAVVIAPLLFALVLFMVFLGRVATTQQVVQRTTRDAARAASIALTRDAASMAVEQTLADGLGPMRQHCQLAPLDLTAIGEDTGAADDWDLGTVQIRLTCTIPTSDLGLLSLGTAKTFVAVATEPVDTWRSRPVNT
jgi:TadE-like protein